MMQRAYPHTAAFRFYEELNDFLPAKKRKRTLAFHFDGRPAVKFAVEALGVPHTEVDLILINGVSVGFDHPVRHGDRVSVYPVFESLDISPVVRLRPKPLRRTAFILDVHLGKLARHLRLLGFDSLYRNDFEDPTIVALSVAQQRIILTRDRHLLQAGVVTHGYWVRANRVDAQVREVVRRFDLQGAIRPFRRCTECNGRIFPVDRADVWDALEPQTRRYYDAFFQCDGCRRIYWKGSHYIKLVARIQGYLASE